MTKNKKEEQELEDQNTQAVEEQNDVNEQASQDAQEQKDPMEELQEQLQTEKDKFLRLFAEFENFKRRTAKERIELFKTAGEGVLKDMLPVLDDFDRAMIEINKSEDEETFLSIALKQEIW